VPEGVPLYAVPQEVAVDVPAIRTYKYMMVNDRTGPFFQCFEFTLGGRTTKRGAAAAGFLALLGPYYAARSYY